MNKTVSVNTEVLSTKTRLDRFISKRKNISKRDVQRILAQKRIQVEGEIATDIQQTIGPFTQVSIDGEILQNRQRCYLMLHKPVGVVSATHDTIHQTVIDILAHPLGNELHITGRLDLNSSGLLLLTNDSKWSRQLMAPENKICKYYRVSTQNPITEDYVKAFQTGMYFAYENITTRPVSLEIINSHTAQVTLTEGRYHQIKRMFGRFRNPVLSIHRYAIGGVTLDQALLPGEARPLTAYEAEIFTQ